MPILPILDVDDPRIEPYRLVRDRDLAGHGGRYVMEGEVVLRAALSSPLVRLDSVLVHDRLEGRDLLDRVPAGVPVYRASGPVLDRIVGFPLHRGILAMGLRGPDVDPSALVGGLPSRSLVLVLAGIANHDNAGGLFRNAAAFGVGAVLLDRSCCDPLYRKSIRVSAGAVLRVPYARGGSAHELCDLLLQEGFAVLATSPGGGQALAELEPLGRAAVLVGTEGPGLPRSLLERLRSVRIPMARGFDSLNVATASGIVLHHLRATHPSADALP